MTTVFTGMKPCLLCATVGWRLSLYDHSLARSRLLCCPLFIAISPRPDSKAISVLRK